MDKRVSNIHLQYSKCLYSKQLSRKSRMLVIHDKIRETRYPQNCIIVGDFNTIINPLEK